MKKGYSYSFSLSSSVYGYEIDTSFFKKTLKGLENVYITRICDRDKNKYDALAEKYSYTIDDAQKTHLEEVQKCLDGAYDNYNIVYCSECHGEGHFHKDDDWLNHDDDNLLECPVCHGEQYKVVIGGD